MKADSISSSIRPLPVIRTFWFGAPLSRLERLCLASFVAHGHPVELYTYEELAGVPPGVTLMDAGTILPQDRLFRHRRTGSVALFADWFRYKLLYEKGGFWVDTDVACLKPFEFDQFEVFGWQDPESICNAVMGFPPGHELPGWLAACCEEPNRILPYDTFKTRLRKWRRRMFAGNRRENIRWGEYGPKGLTLAARHFGYAEKALAPGYFYPVHFHQWRTLFEAGPAAPDWMQDSHAVHLWNNMMREQPGFDKNGRFPEDSPFERLCRRFLKNDG